MYLLLSYEVFGWQSLILDLFRLITKLLVTCSYVFRYSQITATSDWPHHSLHPRCFCLVYNKSAINICIINNYNSKCIKVYKTIPYS